MNFPKTKFLGIALAAGFGLTMLLNSCTKVDTPNDSNQYESQLRQHISDYEIVTIDYDKYWNIAKQKPNSYVKVDLGIKGHPDWNFQLKYDDLKQYEAEGFQQIAIGDNGEQTIIPQDEIYAMEGYNKKEDQMVLLTMGLGEMNALIMEDEQMYSLEPMSNFVKGAPRDQYVLYRAQDLVDKDFNCTMDDDIEEDSANDNLAVSNKTTANKNVEITIFGDYQFFQKVGRSANHAFLLMTTTRYKADKIYLHNGIPITLKAKAAYLHTSGAYANAYPRTTSSAAIFAGECCYYYTQKWYKSGDVNYFFTGDNVVRSIGGPAGIGTMCTRPNRAFSFGEYGTSSVSASILMAHQIGHTMAMGHVNAGRNLMHASYGQWSVNLHASSKRQLLYKILISRCI